MIQLLTAIAMENKIRELIIRELPKLITQDPELHNWVWNIVHEHSPARAEVESRFDKVLAELQRMREESERRWEEDRRRWEENQKRWEENERRWEENQQQIRALIAELRRLERRFDEKIGALGARWGTMSEATFRNALRNILQENFGVKVERVKYKDESGEVFGRPDFVELDVVIYNGQMLVCEIKASVSRDEVYSFERKVRSYEKRTGRKADRAILISPMIHKRDIELARTLGIEVYTSAEDVKPA